MDVSQLIYDLSFGIRLPKPIFCPSPIGNLMNQCFYENPSKRPNFKTIKVFLKDAFNQMMNDANTNSKTCQNGIEQEVQYIEINKLMDDKMKSRYKAIKETNQQEKTIYLCSQNEVVIEKEGSISPLTYACVQSLNSSGNINPQDCYDGVGVETMFNERISSDQTMMDKWDTTHDRKVIKFGTQPPNTLKRHKSLPVYIDVNQIERGRSSKSICTTIIL